MNLTLRLRDIRAMPEGALILARGLLYRKSDVGCLDAETRLPWHWRLEASLGMTTGRKFLSNEMMSQLYKARRVKLVDFETGEPA